MVVVGTGERGNKKS